MSKLSAKQKEKLNEAIETTMDYCADGYAPNDAIIKTAQDLKLTPDHLPILVNAYNAGATAEHWSTGSDVREKTASFPIADIDVIKKKLYPKQTKTATFKPVFDNTFSKSPESVFGYDVLDCYRDDSPMFQKSASVPTEREHTQVNKQLRANIKTAQKRSRDAYGLAEVTLEATLKKLASIVRQQNMPEFEELRKTASAVFGEAGDEVMTCLVEMFPEVTKRKLYVKTAALKSDHPFYSEIQKAISEIKDCFKKRCVKEAVAKKCAEAEEMLTESWKSKLYGDEMDRVILPPIYDEPLKKKELTKTALREELDVPRNMSMLEIMNHPDWQGTTEREYGILSALSDDEHEARLRRIATETMLTDLINTDDFLREQDPEAVLEAYNDILEINPHMATKKMQMRQALREYMASESLDLATLGQLAQLEKGEAEKDEQKKQQRIGVAQQYTAELNKKIENAKERALKQKLQDEDIRARIAEGEANRRLQREEGAKNRKSSEGIAEQNRRSQEREGERNRWSQEDIARENRQSNENIAEANRASNEDIARRQRRLTRLENQKERDFRQTEANEERMWKSDEAQEERNFRRDEADKERDFRRDEAQTERDFRRDEGVLNRTSNEDIARRQRRLTRSENKKERDFRHAEGRLTRKFQHRENDLNRQTTIDEGDRNRLVTLYEGAANRQHQHREGELNRATTRSEGELNRNTTRMEGAANRAVTQSEGAANREHQHREGELNRATTRSEGELNRSTTRMEGAANRAVTQSEGAANRKVQRDESWMNRVFQERENRLNRQNMVDISNARMTFDEKENKKNRVSSARNTWNNNMTSLYAAQISNATSQQANEMKTTQDYINNLRTLRDSYQRPPRSAARGPGYVPTEWDKVNTRLQDAIKNVNNGNVLNSSGGWNKPTQPQFANIKDFMHDLDAGYKRPGKQRP